MTINCNNFFIFYYLNLLLYLQIIHQTFLLILPHLSVFIELKRICALFWIRLWLKERLQLVEALKLYSVQFSSVAQSCRTPCNPMNRSTPGLPVHHHPPEFTQTHVHWVSDAIQPSHPGSSPSPPAPNSSQHQSFFQWANSSHEVATVLEFQL